MNDFLWSQFERALAKALAWRLWRDTDIDMNDPTAGALATLASILAESEGFDFERALISRALALRSSDSLDWFSTKDLVDDLEHEGFERAKLALLDLVASETEFGSAIVAVGVTSGDEAQYGTAVADSGDPREGIDRIWDGPEGDAAREWSWYWSRRISALVDLGRLEECIEQIPAAVPYLALKDPILAMSYGMFAGAMSQSLRQGISRSDLSRISDAMTEGFERTERRDLTSFEMQLSIMHAVKDGAASLSAASDLIVEALSTFGNRLDSHLAADIESARDQLVRVWWTSATVAEKAEIQQAAEDRVGKSSWKILEPDSQDDVLLSLLLKKEVDRSKRIQVLLLFMALERELDALGVTEADKSSLSQKALAAANSDDGRLRTIGEEIERTRVHVVRNALAHGGNVTADELARCERHLLRDGEQWGFIGRVAALKPDLQTPA